MEGIVVKYDPKKRFGFIRSPRYENDLFVHISDVTNSNNLYQGQAVEFDVKNTAKGQAAVSVVAGQKQQSPYFMYGAVSATTITAIAVYLYIELRINPFIAYLVGVNITTFIMYGYDKIISGSEKTRIPEIILQALALIGGSPAALVAQKFFRHKTVKGSFQLIYWLIVIAQVIAFGMLM